MVSASLRVCVISTRTRRVTRHNFPRSCFSSVFSASSAVKRRFQDKSLCIFRQCLRKPLAQNYRLFNGVVSRNMENNTFAKRLKWRQPKLPRAERRNSRQAK